MKCKYCGNETRKLRQICKGCDSVKKVAKKGIKASETVKQVAIKHMENYPELEEISWSRFHKKNRII